MKWKNKKTGEIIECSPTLLNASKVSAQNRKRLFWVGKLDKFGTYQKVEIPQPEDKGILLKDILEENVSKEYSLEEKSNINYLCCGDFRYDEGFRWRKNGKCPTISTKGGGSKSGSILITDGENIRRLTPIECERLQGLPDNYTDGVSNTQRYKQLGNAFNVDVVAHIIIKLTLPSRHILELLKNYENQ